MNGGRLPAAPWVEAPDLEGYLARSGFDRETETFVRSLARDGYAVIDLGPEAQALCERAVAETDSYFERPGVSRVQDAWLASPAVRRLAGWPKVERLLEAAYGRKGFPFQTLNFKRGSQQALHPDTIHFHSAPERFMCGVWIALEDVRPEAGPLVYHPGSHRLPVMTMREAGVNGRPGPEHYEPIFEKRFAERIAASGLPAQHAMVKKGQAFVWAANLAHGGSPVRDPASTRRSLVVHWYFEDCVYYTPVASDVESGDLALRLPMDARTGRLVWPRRDGQRVFPGVKPLLIALMKRLQHRPHVQ